MTYEEAKTIKTALEAESKRLGKLLNDGPKGPMGLTPDHIKFSPEFQAAKRAYERTQGKIATFNRMFLKVFAKEYAAERRARYAAWYEGKDKCPRTPR